MFIFIGILLLALGLRIFYFILTNGQASWWDSAEYLSQGQHYLNSWKGITDTYMVNFQRPPAFQFIIATILAFELGESAIIFLCCIIPSFILVFLVFLLGKEMFNEKVGLIASLFTTVSWTLLFWTPRAQPDFISMCFQVAALYFFFKCINNNDNINKNMFISGALAAASFSFKISGLLVPLVIFIYLCFIQQFKIFKKKENWMFLAGFILLILPYLIWAWISFGNPFIVRSGYQSAMENQTPFAWWVLDYFSILFSDTIFFMLFIFSFTYIAFITLTKLDLELKQPSKEFTANWFTILILIVTACFYIFYIGGIEDRWVFIWLPFLFYAVSSCIIKVFDLLHNKVHKILAWSILILLLLFLSYGQLTHADSLIKNKLPSYAPVKDASLWIQANSYSTEPFMTTSYTQMFFYSKRPTYTYSNLTEEQFEEWYPTIRPRYLVASIFEPQAQWIFIWVQNNSRVTPVMVYFNDPQTKTQPVLIIYQFNYNI